MAELPKSDLPKAEPSKSESTGWDVSKLGLRAMTGYEEEVAERRRNEPNTAALCNDVVAHCMVPPGADATEALDRVRSLLVAQRDVAVLRIRRLSLGDDVNMVATCPQCQKGNDIDFKLSLIPVDFGNPPERLEVLVGGDIPVSLRLPTAGDQEALIETPLHSDSERRSWLLSRVIVKYGDRNGPFDMTFARGLALGVRRALEEALEKVVPDLDLTMAMTCYDCGYKFKSAFDVRAFFLPR